MIDSALLRSEPAAVAANLARRGYTLPVDALAKIEATRRRCQSEAEQLRADRNEKSRAIGELKKQKKDADAQQLMREVDGIKKRIKALEADLETAQQQYEAIALDIPNLLHASVPDGADDAANAQVRRWGDPPQWAWTAQTHDDLGEQLQLVDFALAVRLAGARFVTLRGDIARLHRALAQFMLAVHANEHGYEEVYLPYLANTKTLTGTGQLPKFKDDLFQMQDGDLHLIPTAEVVATNIVQDRIVAADELPMKFVCHSPCFRREAGSYGRDTRGMLRQHQFDKVELVIITTPGNSYDALESLTQNAETILQRLELPYRVVSLCSGDIGFAAAKTYDLEVWLPGQSAYREISSCSNCEAFQARRMRARYRAGGGKPDYLHTLNGSGVAVGRALIAVMENYQNQDGSITIPEALRPYMDGKTTIAAPAASAKP